MYYIISEKSGRIHREPNKKSYASTIYKTAGAAKAGITRTIKFYEKAIADVQSVVAEGKPEYHSPLYNHYRTATDKALGRTHNFDINNFKVVAVDDYVEPQVTRTGIAPGTGKKITVTMGINEVGGVCDPLTETYWSM